MSGKVHKNERNDPRKGPYKFTDDLKSKFCEHIANGLLPSQACRATGISRATYEDHYDRDPVFRTAINDAKEEATDKVVNALFEKCIVDKDTHAIKFWLTNRRLNEWAESKNIKVQGEQKTEYILKWHDELVSSGDIPDDNKESNSIDNPSKVVSSAKRDSS